MISRRKMLIMDSLKEYTVIGNPVTFNTNITKPLNQLLIPFYPVQDGIGDPSPSNIRPITGWTGFTAYRTGKNLLNPNSTRTKGNFTGDGNIGTASSTYVFGIPCNHNTTYALYTSTADGSITYRVGLTKVYPQAGVYVDYLATRSQGNGPYVINTGNNNFIALATTATVERISTTMIILGNSTTEVFESYTGITIPVTFSNTFYGGVLNLNTGVLTIDTGYIASYNGETLPGTWISDRDVYSAGSSPSIGAEVAYELSEPIVYNLSGINVPVTLIGDNVIYSDTNGNNTIKYYKKG